MSRDPDAYTVVLDGPEVETKVKGSRFLGRAFAADTVEIAEERLAAVRKRAHDATHHCSAWRVGVDEPATRSDDDGEPSGTAGAPILAPLEREDLRNVLVVVTRYYGGTKLGTGGLARAYGEASREALAAAGREVRYRREPLVVECGFDQVGAVEPLLARHHDSLLAVERAFDPGPRFSLAVKRSRVEAVWAELVEATAGRIERVEAPA